MRWASCHADSICGKGKPQGDSRLSGSLAAAKAVVDAACVRGYIELVRGRRQVKKMQGYSFSTTVREVNEA